MENKVRKEILKKHLRTVQENIIKLEIDIPVLEEYVKQGDAASAVDPKKKKDENLEKVKENLTAARNQLISFGNTEKRIENMINEI